MSHQLLHGLGRRPDESRLIRLLAKKQRGGDGANVLTTLDQRLQMTRHDIKPPVKVGTELPAISQRRQIAVARGNDTDLDRYGMGCANGSQARKSVVSGKSVSVRLDLVGRRIIKNKNSNTNIHK